MNAPMIAALSDRLVAAEMTRTPIELPSVEYPGLTVEDGYQVQRAIVAKKVAGGARVIGKKVAFTSRANQEIFGVREPAYGQLLDRGVHQEHAPVEVATLIDPLIDCEITFVMRRHLVGPGVTVRDVVRATEAVVPSLEIADSRMRDWIGRATVADIIADSCGNAGIILGGGLRSLRRFDLRCTGVVVEKNGTIIATAATAAVMGNPAQSVAWLANKLAEAELALEEGELVLAGALVGSVRMVAGDTLTAVFGGGLGPVGVKFI